MIRLEFGSTKADHIGRQHLYELESKLLKGDFIGSNRRVFKRDTRSLDYSSHAFASLEPLWASVDTALRHSVFHEGLATYRPP